MKTKTAIFVILGLLISAPAFATPEHEHKMPAPKVGSAEFEKIKALAGTWKGNTLLNGKEEPAEIDYKVTSNGSAVVETLFPGTPQEMVSVYTDHGGKLSMTHYCAMGNQPQLDLAKTEGNTLDLAFSPSSGVQPGEDRMDSLKITIEGNKITQTWTGQQGGKPGEPTVISVQKV